MEAGFVQMPLERYDELILENKYMMEELDDSVPLAEYNKLKELLDNVVRIEPNWNNEPRLVVNIGLLSDVLVREFEQTEFTGKWLMKDLSGRIETIWDTFKEVPQDADEEDEDQA